MGREPPPVNDCFWPMTACRQRQQWAALCRSCLLSVLVKSDAIVGLIECKRLVKCNTNEWSVPMPSGGQVECNFARVMCIQKGHCCTGLIKPAGGVARFFECARTVQPFKRHCLSVSKEMLSLWLFSALKGKISLPYPPIDAGGPIVEAPTHGFHGPIVGVINDSAGFVSTHRLALHHPVQCGLAVDHMIPGRLGNAKRWYFYLFQGNRLSACAKLHSN